MNGCGNAVPPPSQSLGPGGPRHTNVVSAITGLVTLYRSGPCEPFFSLFNLTERQVLSCISFGYSALAFYVDGGRILQMLCLLHRNKLRVTLSKTNGGFIDLNKASHLLVRLCLKQFHKDHYFVSRDVLQLNKIPLFFASRLLWRARRRLLWSN